MENINRLFRNMTARKISVLSRLAGLNEEEVNIMRMRWLDNLSDIQICDRLGMSTATLSRKRSAGHKKIIDALDLYGLSDLESLPVSEILDYDGLFYRCQDELIRFFIHNVNDKSKQEQIYSMLKLLND